MWLTSSSVGRKFIMALTGACLVLFVTFHCVMNAVCICWPTAYNSICEFLGANWYALIASVGLAALFIIHIIYACWLTLQNRKARGSVRYAIERRPANVEWSSKNMLVLGIVILAFLVVHLIQFWAKMQLQEIRGTVEVIPAAAGTLFIQEAFSLVWTPIVYIIGFIALWFHMNHGFWSMFESIGWTNDTWIPRLKKIGCCWTSIVIALFIAQAIVFTVQAHNNHYKTDSRLRSQYQEMVAAEWERDFGPDAAQLTGQFMAGDIEQNYNQMTPIMENLKANPFPSFEEFAKGAPSFADIQSNPQYAAQFPGVNSQAELDAYLKNLYDKQKKTIEKVSALYDFYGYLLGKDVKEEAQQEEMALPQEEVQTEAVMEEQVEEVVSPADTQAAQPANNEN